VQVILTLGSTTDLPDSGVVYRCFFTVGLIQLNARHYAYDPRGAVRTLARGRMAVYPRPHSPHPARQTPGRSQVQHP